MIMSSTDERHRRKPVTFVSLATLLLWTLLSLVVLLAWIRSYWRLDSFGWHSGVFTWPDGRRKVWDEARFDVWSNLVDRKDGLIFTYRELMGYSGGGQLAFVPGTSVYIVDRQPGVGEWWSDGHPVVYPNFWKSQHAYGVPRPDVPRIAGIGYRPWRIDRIGKHSWFCEIVLPYWLLFVIFAVPLAWQLRTVYRRRCREGLCPTCGYDLRATPDRCPECGIPVPAGHRAEVGS